MATNSGKGQGSGQSGQSPGDKVSDRRAAEKDEKALRLAAALRQNLRRRKAQARGRKSLTGEDD